MTRQLFLRIVNFAVFISLTAFFIFLAFRGVQVKNFWADLKAAKYSWILFALALGFFSHIVRAYRWNLLIEPLGYKPRLVFTTMAIFIGYFANMALPRLGEITRCGSLSRSDKVPVQSLIGTVIMERAFDVVVMILLLFTVFFARISFFGTFIKTHIFSPLFTNFREGSLSAGFLVTVTLLATIIAFIVVFRKQLRQLAWYRKTAGFLQGMKDGIQSLFKIRNIYLFLLATAVLWALYLLTTYLIFFSIPATAELTLIDALFILVFASIGMIIPVQGGFGTYHFFVALGLSIYGISREEGLVYAIIAHESQSIMLILTGCASLLIVFLSGRRASTISDP